MNTKKLNFFYKGVVQCVKDLSSCARLHVGSIICKDGRIISTGYNGTTGGSNHCDRIFITMQAGEKTIYKINVTALNEFMPGVKYTDFKYTTFETDFDTDIVWVSKEDWFTWHHKFSESAEIHSEMNAIAFAAKNNLDITGAEIVVSTAPCINCAKLIVASGIKTVKFIEEYDRSSEGVAFLERNKVKIEQI